MGKAFYKGGFEPKMNKREASLILSLKYDLSSPFALGIMAREREPTD